MSKFSLSSLSNISSKITNKISSSKVSKTLENAVQDKYVLYFVFFLSLTNLLGYLMVGNYRAIAVFVLLGYMLSFYTKNMIIILSVPLVLTSVLLVGKRVKEGMENNNIKKDEKKDSTENDKKDSTESAKKDSTESVKMDSMESAKMDNKKVNKENKQIDIKLESVKPKNDEPIEDDKKEHYTGYKRKNNRLDYAATIENAYGDLTNILGKGGIKGLTEDTQKLMSQQLELADAMKNMTPLLDQAKSMLQSIDLKSLNSIASFAKGFGSTERD